MLVGRFAAHFDTASLHFFDRATVPAQLDLDRQVGDEC
jgi:hypothetical protein